MKTKIQAIRKKIYRLWFKLGTNQFRITHLRRQGATIGQNCLIFPGDFGSEPYLIEIGNHVAIAGKCTFINHEGAEWPFREEYPKLNVFGKIIIGDNTFVGIGCTIMPGTVIGSNCIIGADSVVRGNISDDSVVFGNPAKVVMKTSMCQKLLVNNKNRLDTKGMEWTKEREIVLKHFNKQGKR